VKQFAARSTGIDSMDRSLLGELSQLEHYLLTSQAVMSVRGKVRKSTTNIYCIFFMCSRPHAYWKFKPGLQ